jgi:hypothetical protein
MDITSKIYLETNVFICLNLQNNKLYYELEYNEEKYDEEAYNKFNVYEKNDTGINKYHDIYYKKIIHSPITKNKLLKEGFYLFVFNKTKLFIEFINNKISYELEDIGIETETDLS